MRQYNIKWARFLEMLPIWERLPLEARRVAMDKLLPQAGVPLAALDEQGPTLIQVGLADAVSGGKAKPADRFRAAMMAMRAMLHFDVFGSPPPLEQYISWQFAREECATLLRGGADYYRSHALLAAKAESPSWIETFLAAKSDDDWLGDMITGEPAHGLRDPAVFTATQWLVRHIMSLRQPPTFGELMGAMGKGPQGLLPEAIRAGIEGALLFPSLRRADLEPVLGIWPAIAERLHRAPATVPAPLERPREVFCAAWWIEDMSCLVAAAAREPLRLRSDDSEIFARQREKLEAQLIEAPEWLSGLCKDDRSRDAGRTGLINASERLSSAQRAARYMGLIKTRPTKTRQAYLTVTPEGMEWLGLSPKERLKNILDEMTGDRPRRGVIAGEYYDDGVLSFLPAGFQIEIAGRYHQPRAELARAFATLKSDHFFIAHAFIRYQSECANPIPDMARKAGEAWRFRIRSGWSAVEINDVQIEAYWASMLDAFIWQRLVPLGGAAIGRPVAAHDHYSLALTGAGRYLLGMRKDFEYGKPAEATLVVQPNFEIVFLSPDPVQEANCSRFAERLDGRRHVGTLFRITKASITEAAAVGIGLDQVITALASASSKPLPANVEQEIRGWFGSFRDVNLRPATLIECPDAETATRVLACAGDDATRISEVLFEYRGSGGKLELIKALRARGLFVRR